MAKDKSEKKAKKRAQKDSEKGETAAVAMDVDTPVVKSVADADPEVVQEDKPSAKAAKAAEKQKKKRKRVEADKDSDSDSSSSSSEDEEETGSKKRTSGKNSALLAVDLGAEAPLSRKQRRQKKKEEALEKAQAKGEAAAAAAAAPAKPKRSEHGVWIGNLTYATTKKTLQEFFASCGKATRIHMPMSGPNTNRGFAYVDFGTAEETKAAVALSEKLMGGRKVLIKDAHDFTKLTPVKEASTTDESGKPAMLRGNQRQRQNNTPAVTLFVGNLPFEATKIDVQKVFAPFGKIRKVRLMTFEDTGKCKGFAYVDYKELEGAKAAVESPQSHYLEGRRLRVEYGSAEAVRRGAPWVHDPKGLNKRQQDSNGNDGGDGDDDGHKHRHMPSHSQTEADAADDGRVSRRKKRRMGDTPSLAPPAPVRGPMAAVPFEGSKVVFGDDDDNQ